MQAEIKWLDDPTVFRVGPLDAHSDHMFYASEKEAAEGKSSLIQLLDGVWKFHYSVNAKVRPADFWKTDFDASGFDEIQVPGHIEMAGYDTINYINQMYPWDGKIFRRPRGTGMKASETEGDFSEADYNPVGSYLCRFDLNPALRGHRVVLRFEGVEQAAFVWLNGEFLGYTEDSFSMTEFDLTGCICDAGNVLAVEVHKRSTAAYLESQDFFRFFGIFRHVSLQALPAAHVQDLWIRPEVELSDCSGKAELDLKLSGALENVKVTAAVKEGEKILLESSMPAAGSVSFVFNMPAAVTLWEHHNPKLYRLEVRLYGADGTLLEVVPQDFGFRKIEIRDKVVLLNGKRLILNGINRHEWDARGGRCITDEDEQFDMDFIVRNHMNAVRTCHYPDRLTWYNLCDRNGIYMMAENNLESHGSWQKLGEVEPSWNVPGSLPEWKSAVLDRAKSNFETFKNHVSVLFWSLGNESYCGDDIEAMNAYYKQKDPSRLTHYENVCRNRKYEDTVSDLESMMYAPPWDVKAYLDQNPKKPYILCEYMHDMGNSLGGLGSYYKLIDEYPGFCGGFIWDYIDQAVLVKDEVTGREVLRYGGDFDDRPSDYEFAGNGVLFADRTEKPAMQEVRAYYERYDG